MGSGRGGAYTYDWIENLLGLNMHSARQILQQFQDLQVGDELPLGPGRPVMRVEVCDPEQALAIRIADGNWVGALFTPGLVPAGTGPLAVVGLPLNHILLEVSGQSSERDGP